MVSSGVYGVNGSCSASPAFIAAGPSSRCVGNQVFYNPAVKDELHITLEIPMSSPRSFHLILQKWGNYPLPL